MGEVMKRSIGFAILFCSLSLSAFAAKNAQNVTLWSPVTVGTTNLAAGVYKVSWAGTGSDVQVTISQGKKTFVTLPAKLVAADNRNVSVGTRTVQGADILETIQLDKCNLVLTPRATSLGEEEDRAH